jgi:hypothetical protein
MDLSKIRRGEMVAAVGGLVLLIALFFFNWYSAGAEVSTPLGSVNIEGDFGAWDGQGFLGTVANLVILAAAVAAVGLAVVTATSRTVALPVAASALTAGLGIGAVVMVLLRMLFQPGPNNLIDLKFGILLALIGALVVAYGGWQSMKEEGTSFEAAGDQLRSRYTGTPGAPAAPRETAAPPAPEPGAPPAPETVVPPAPEPGAAPADVEPSEPPVPGESHPPPRP